MGILFWRRQPKPVINQSQYDVLDDVVPDDEDLYGIVSERLLPGYSRLEDVVQDLVEEYQEALETETERTEETFRHDVTWMARTLWHGRRLDEADYEAMAASEHHRVAAAFKHLSGAGFVTGECLGDDQSSAFALARAARHPTADGGHDEWAYAYFHEQDAAVLSEMPAKLFIAFGAFTTSPSFDDETVNRAMLTDRGRAAIEDQSRLDAGQKVAAALIDAGLIVEWDGTTGRRIVVHVERWLHPLPVIDFDDARDMADRERLLIRWPEDGAMPDALAIAPDDGWWRVWATDERGGAWSEGRRFSFLPDALDHLIDLARDVQSGLRRVPPHR
ncbi:hypothetical protein [Curtobacterium sp. VKM Ac-2922]|uniref:DUF6891 domain-containing protein n=1 Tax=Curtobacterium sp. VKM Ac-2922 TaxID=2929475 RepID=UPI001FB4BF5A|nr:hypothetical protein [Curtobacterium sp. VKM Ac-2922]MCJ1712885.1 hypothetical protein [Curtobacterium sp. VKM Ac-2922]